MLPHLFIRSPKFCELSGPAQRAHAGGPTNSGCSCGGRTVGFHNFNLRIFNLRVSNQNKLIVDVFLTRCRISLFQGLGPKKHDDILKTDRSRRGRLSWRVGDGSGLARGGGSKLASEGHTYMYVCMYVCIYIYIYMYVCMYVCMYVYVCIYIYIYVYIISYYI